MTRSLWRSVRDFLASAILAMFGAAVGLVGVAAMDREPPRVDIVGRSIAPAYHVGEPFQGEWHLTYARDCPGFVIRWVTSRMDTHLVSYLNSEDILSGAILSNTLPSVTTVPVAPWIVPNLPPGPADYHLYAEFSCNLVQKMIPLARIAVEYPSIPFIVLSSEDK